MRSMFPMLVALVLAAGPAAAQNFTTTAEVKPILTATKPSWIAVREYDGHDLVYFTQIEAWRCGLEAIRYGINTGAADTPFDMEPCHEGEAAPNALKVEGHLPYISLPLGSVESVTVEIRYDDGSTDQATYSRAGVMIQ